MSAEWRSRIPPALIIGLAIAGCHASPSPVQSTEASNALLADVAYLASEELEGRSTGSRGAAAAAAFVVRRYVDLGLTPAFPACDSDSGCSREFFQEVPVPERLRAFAELPAGAARNIGAMVQGTDTSVRHEFLIVGAHIDHLGLSPLGALPSGRPGVRLGADDNASGTAVVLELARRVVRRPVRRSVLFLNFAAEELGLLGSSFFVAHPPVSRDSIVAMLNFDMVGYLRNNRLIVSGAGSAGPFRAIVDSVNGEVGLALSVLGGMRRNSDDAPFRARGIPALRFHTGMHPHYHNTTDRADNVNAPGMVVVTELAERVLRAIADRKD